MFAEREDDRELDVHELLRLAGDRSAAARTQLVEIVSDLFFDTSHVLSERERASMTDILRQLIQDVEVTVRKHLAIQLSDEPEAPLELVQALANDSAEIAHPILKKSVVLQDPELIEIIRNRSLEHQLAIAMRKDVSEAVSDALVETDDHSVIETLLQNEGATIAQETMSYLVEQSQRVDNFQNPLVRRHDLPEALAKKMYWWVSAALRTEILQKHDLDADQLDDVIESAVEAAVRSDESSKTKDAAATRLVNQLIAKHGTDAELLIRLLRAGEVSLFEHVVERHSNLRQPLVRRLIYEPGGEGLAILCRALSYRSEEFTTLLVLCRKARSDSQAANEAVSARAASIYQSINPEAARRVLDRWRRNPDYLDLLRQVEALETVAT